MLSTLDTVIAFAVIMTVLSLLITLIVQMVSAAFPCAEKIWRTLRAVQR